MVLSKYFNDLNDLYPLENITDIDQMTSLCNLLKSVREKTVGQKAYLSTLELELDKIESELAKKR